MADAGAAPAGGETPVNNQDLCGFCRKPHRTEDCLASKICTGLMRHASLHIAQMREEAQAERAATTTNKAKGASENPNADKACLYCEAPGHEITGCLMARCVAIMICQVAGIDPRPIEQSASEPAPEATTKTGPEGMAVSVAVPETAHETTDQPKDDSEKPPSEAASPEVQTKKKRVRRGKRARKSARTAAKRAAAAAAEQAAAEEAAAEAAASAEPVAESEVAIPPA